MELIFTDYIMPFEQFKNIDSNKEVRTALNFIYGDDASFSILLTSNMKKKSILSI